MEKSKNRTDLLAAGRKKLQQFRQKKDHKGSSSSSHGKSSHNASKNEQMGDEDADVAPLDSLVIAEMVKVAETIPLADAKVASDDLAALPVTALLVSLAEGEAEPAPFLPLASPSAKETNGAIQEENSDDLPMLLPSNRETSCASPPDQEANHLGSGQWNASGTDGFQSTLGGESLEDGISSMENGRNDANGSTSLEDARVKEDADALPDPGLGGSQEMDRFSVPAGEPCKGEGSLSMDRFSVPSEEPCKGEGSLSKDDEPFVLEHSEMGAVEVKEDAVMGVSPKLGIVQEVDGLPVSAEVPEREGNLSASSMCFKIEVSTLENERDGQPFVSEDGMMNEDRMMVDADVNVDLRLGRCQEADDFVVQAETTCNSVNPVGECEESTSHEEILEIPSPFQDVSTTNTRECVLLANAEGEAEIDSQSNGKGDFQGGAVTIERGCPGKLPEGGPISVDEKVDGLSEEKASFQLRSSDSAALRGLWDMENSIFLGADFADGLESLKRQLYLTNVAKDFFQLQLAEHTVGKSEVDLHLSDEVSRLRELVKETQDSSARVREELARCRSKLRAMASEKDELEVQCISVRGEIEELSATTCGLQNKLELSQEESANISAELADCKGLLGAIQMENSNLTACLTSGSEEKKKLEEEKEYLASVNKRLASELSEQKEQLNNALDKQVQLESDLKETMASVEKLTEENILLSSSLDIYILKLKEIDERHQEFLSQAKEYGDCLKGSTVHDLVGNSATEDSQTGQVKCDIEVVLGTSEKSVSHFHDLRPLLEQVEEKDFGDLGVFGNLKGHLEEAEQIMQKLENAIQGMHSHSVSLSKSGGRVAASGISKLIQAFESKAHPDDGVSDEVSLIEGEKSEDSFTLAKGQTYNLRAILKQMGLDVEKIQVLYKESQCSRRLTSELEVACETQKLKNEKFEAKIDELVKELSEYKLGMDDLQSQLDNMWQNADVEAERMLSQVMSLQNEVNYRTFSLECAVDSIRVAISEAIEKLDATTGLLVSGNLDIDSHVTASVTAATKAIEGLQEKLAAAYLDRETGLASFEELYKDFADMQGRMDLASGILNGIHSSLKELVSDSCGYTEETEMDKAEELPQLLLENCKMHIEQLKKLLDERFLLHSVNTELKSELISRSQDIEEVKNKCLILSKNLEDSHSTNDELELLLAKKSQAIEELNRRCLALAKKLDDHQLNKHSKAVPEFVENVEGVVKVGKNEGDSGQPTFLHIEASVALLLQKYEEAIEQINLSKNFLREVIPPVEFSNDKWSMPLHFLLKQEIVPKVMEMSELQEKMNWLSSSNLQKENEMKILKESLSKMEVALETGRTELHTKITELDQSEQRLSSVRDKLSIAVAKGKGLIVQRDSLKQSLVEKSSELENCLKELQLKEAMLHEVEAKLKSYSEADRVEALESELSYIRNSATALRDSFLLKDSILQRIEEVLEDLDLPEDFHSKDIIEKIELLTRSIAGNTSFPSTEWDHKSSVGHSHSDAGFVAMDSWKDESQPTSNSGFDDLKRKYEELQSKFYGLAEHNDMLEQSLMERNNLVQRWEEVLDKIDLPLQLRSMESEDRIEWLGRALPEVQQERDSLILKIEKMEFYTDSLIANLDELQKKISELDAAFVAVKREKEFLSESLDKLRCEQLEFSQKEVQYELEKDGLQKEIADLQNKLGEKLENKDYHDMVNELEKLQDLVGNALPDHDKVDMFSTGSHSECLEGLLRKLIDNYKALSFETSMCKDTEECVTDESNLLLEGQKLKHLLDDKEQDLVALRIELDEASHNLVLAKKERDTAKEKYDSLILETESVVKQRDALLEERDRSLEKYQSLILEVESMAKQRDALQEQLNQEEQRAASVREKLNVAVRKGKGLVQQRDSLKQTIEEMNIEVECLKNKHNQKLEALESEKMSLKNRLAEVEHRFQGSSGTLSGLLSALHAIDLNDDVNIVDPVRKMEAIVAATRDFRAVAVSSENEAKKAKRASELLLAELNEVQERADILQEELAKAKFALGECSRQRDVAEAARADAVEGLVQFRILHSTERKKQLGGLMELKTDIDKLRKGWFSFSNLLADVFCKDMDLMCNIETGMESILKHMNGANAAALPALVSSRLLSSSPMSEDKSLFLGALSEESIPEYYDDSLITEYLGLADNSIHEYVKELDHLKEKVQKHFSTVEQQATHLSIIMEILQRETAFLKESSESLNRDVTRLEITNKDKETEVSLMRRNIALLYEACSSSILEIESRKVQMFGNGLDSRLDDLDKTEMIFKIPSDIDRKEPADGHALSFTEVSIRKMAETLLSTVKGSSDIEVEIVEGNQRELKATILDLQRELQEKDIQSNRICSELVSQIREAEAVAKKYLVDLQSAKAQVSSLENQIKVIENDKELLELRVNELKNWESSCKDLQERIKSLTDALTAKDQEIEGLMQALDEEESQMESLENRNQELEKIVQQKNVALDNLEASRAKVVAKLSTTVNKFDELHHLSESLLAEVENLQSQLQGRDSEISFLRQEVTRCTNDVLAEQESKKKYMAEMHELQRWMNMTVSRFDVPEMHFDDQKISQIHACTEFLDKQIASVIAELDDLRIATQNNDVLLQTERGRVEELSRKEEILENSLREKESQIQLFQGVRDSGQPSTLNSLEPLEVEPVRNKRATLGSIAPHVRGGRKVNSDQIAIGIDLEQDNGILDDEDDDKAHGFKSLTMSRVVPRATRSVADRIDGLWVSIDRLLMRQPTLRLGLIIYWVALHALLAASI